MQPKRNSHPRAAWLAIPLVLSLGCGKHQGPGEIEGAALPSSVVAERSAVQAQASRSAGAIDRSKPAKRVLFGDLHVHTTYSADAFMWGLPFVQGEGARPVADACDFARYCSGLDFWSINDHAESLTPQRWEETKRSIRECNARAGDPNNPDMVSYLGWEWTQIGQTAADHYGHKNVILRDLDDEQTPRRPIHSASYAARAMRQRPPLRLMAAPFLDWPHRQRYFDLIEFQRETRESPWCEDDVDTRELPDDCMEGAATPEVLFRKLDEWGHESMVIPHGTTWGIYTPRGSAWDKQLNSRQHDPDRQTLIEVFSGHGNSEEFRDVAEITLAEDGTYRCPEPVGSWEPCCWRAGEIFRARCEDPQSPECEKRVVDARRIFLDAGPVAGRITVPGATLADWKDCESCPGCFAGSMNYRPRSSVQYLMALGNHKDAASAKNFHFGFMASSDNHRARPGTGYKEIGRLWSTDAHGAKNRWWYEQVNATEARSATDEAVPYDAATTKLQAWQVMDFERQASFFMTGGLVAVHSEGRSRGQIWQALQRREVYGTSGDRILLWFDLVNAKAGPVTMGGKATMDAAPRFRVRALGAREQLPGCADSVSGGLSAERLQSLCRGECYHPGDQRRRIKRIEVVRIRPQAYQNEPIAELIEDPWKVIRCPQSNPACVVEFEDNQFTTADRLALYYVRAIQEPTPAINTDGVRCKRDASGRCLEARPCYGDYRTPPDDDCLAMNEERAWSSPIFISPVTKPAP